MKRGVTLCFASLLAFSASAQNYTFTKLARSSGLFVIGDSRGVALSDYDRDGMVDVFVAKTAGNNRLFHNLGDLKFEEVAAQAGLVMSGDNRVGVWADYDNDTWPDLFVGNVTQYRLFRNLGNGTFEKDTTAGIHTSIRISGAMWADVDNNGHVDLYTPNLNSNNCFFLNNRNGTFRDGIGAAGLQDTQEPSMGGAFGDYDNDGDLDLYLVHDAYQANRLYRNAGYGYFNEVARDARVALAAQGMTTTFADFDNDGWLDLYITNLDTNTIYFNNGNGTFTNTTQISGVGDRGMSWGIVVLDYDNDMWQDIYVLNASNFPPLYLDNVLYRNLGNRKFEVVTSKAGVSSKLDGWGGATGDLNNDGNPDLLITNWTSDCLQAFINNGGPNHYLKVSLLGTECNRYAIGARVRVVANGMQQIRELSGGAGYMSQDSPILHFGLAQNAKVDTLEIQWPGGARERFFDVAADQQVNYVEGQATAVAASPISLPTSMRLHPSYPNPFAPNALTKLSETAITFELANAGHVAIAVFDVQGRRIVTLFEGAKAAGSHVVHWNGRDTQNNFVSAGIYIVQMKSAGQRLNQKVTVLR